MHGAAKPQHHSSSMNAHWTAQKNSASLRCNVVRNPAALRTWDYQGPIHHARRFRCCRLGVPGSEPGCCCESAPAAVAGSVALPSARICGGETAVYAPPESPASGAAEGLKAAVAPDGEPGSPLSPVAGGDAPLAAAAVARAAAAAGSAGSRPRTLGEAAACHVCISGGGRAA
jgi:hypothetical protein